MAAKRNKNGRMFTFDADILEVQATMFEHGRGVITNIEIWHKCIGHVNIQRMKSMQTHNIIANLLKFRVDGIQKICEACQMGN